MKLHWLIPLTADTVFQFTSKNELARSFTVQGNEITTLIAYVDNKTPMDGFTSVQYIHTPKGSILKKLNFHWQMLKSTWAKDNDVVMFGFQAAHLIPLACAVRFFRRFKPKFLMDIRTVPVDVPAGLKGKIELARYNLSLKIADFYCDGLTVITPMLRDSIKNKLSRLSNNIGVWTSGVQLSHFKRQGRNKRLELGLKDKCVLLYHGVLSPNRGLQNALKAVDILRDEIPNLHFLLVGDGLGKNELQQLVKQYGIEDRITFTGKVPYQEIANYLRSADLSILPFPNIDWWSVSSPIKLMEYLAIGIPIVATDIDANRWVLEQAGGGRLALDYSPEELAKAICEIIRNGIAPAPLETLEETISWNKQAKDLAAYISTILAV